MTAAAALHRLRKNLERWRAYYLLCRANGNGALALREVERIGRQLKEAVRTLDDAAAPRAAREGAWSSAVRATARARALLQHRTEEVGRGFLLESLPDLLPPGT